MSMWQKFTRWWNNDDEIDSLVAQLAIAHRKFNQSQFLLDSAQMLDAPRSAFDGQERLASIRSKYGFIHPKTLSKFTNWVALSGNQVEFLGSPTRWTATPIMPEDRIVLTSLPMPFQDVEKK